MTDPKRLTALEYLTECCSLSLEQKNRHHDAKLVNSFDMESYYTGEAVGYTDSHAFMKRELQRLKNLFQNGALTVEDFGVY